MWTGNLAIRPAERKAKGTPSRPSRAWIMGKKPGITRRPAAASVSVKSQNAAVGRPPPSPGSGHAAACPQICTMRAKMGGSA